MEKRQLNDHEIDEAVLRCAMQGDTTLGTGMSGFLSRFLETHEVGGTWPREKILETIWSLISRNLLYIGFTYAENDIQNNPTQWRLTPTAKGKRAISDPKLRPDLPKDYLSRFVEDESVVSETTLKYLREALECYQSRLYLAATVMLGVAAENEFTLMAHSFCRWLSPDEAKGIRSLLESPQSNYGKLIKKTRSKLIEVRKELPLNTVDGLEIQLDATVDLIRRYRNDVGHPKDVEISESESFVLFTVFAVATRRMQTLEIFFDENPRVPEAEEE